MSDEPPSSDAVVTPLRKRYEAFRAMRDPVPRLALCATASAVSVPYYAIADILFDGIKDEVSFTIRERHDVKISGGNLRDVFDFIHLQVCALVQEFDERVFLPPTRGSRDVFIARIEIVPRPEKPKTDPA